MYKTNKYNYIKNKKNTNSQSQSRISLVYGSHSRSGSPYKYF